ncbi:MAG: double-strand break repair helicase AddA [Hyphomicrobiaceae bacterium]|nr:double-strand break repair helicase AddA [Hyphomicrobiaceae bacterium]MCC0023975.1 double-strand break repair helicase AddA [Hyphomicrobiaceae bacterium]
MTEERAIVISPEAAAAQGRAANPGANVFVSANAGAGKTFVLTQRVLRILLTGVAPENVLCLTYTKAAAAEMQNRVAERLGKWAILGDEDLDEELVKLTGQQPGDATRNRARTLFALALETPGGLKIKTIHGFCESVLHRFPLEADIPMGFSVIEDDERRGLILAARNQVLAGGLGGDPQLSDAVTWLFDHFSDFQINEALDAALQARDLARLLKQQDDARANLRKLLDLADPVGPVDLETEVLNQRTISQDDAKLILSITPPRETYKDAGFAEHLAAFDWQKPDHQAWLGIFLTKDWRPRATLAKKKLADSAPELDDKLRAEQERLVALIDHWRATNAYLASEALLTLIDGIYRRYNAEKKRRARLDFDDLIDKLLTLLRDRDSRDWVRYKLDAQITHILVDESQDTNPDQWETVEKLIEEFFAGDGAVVAQRSIFAVGDEKQSIYSFQGAEPELFAEVRDRTDLKARQAGSKVDSERLIHSFRTLDMVLKAVDLVAENDDVREALLAVDAPVHHVSSRKAKGGSVTLWPPIVAEPKASSDEDALSGEAQEHVPSVHARLAGRITGQIAHWLKSGRRLATRENAIRPGDILILVQSRGELYAEIIKRLKQRGLPTPGADILPVTHHIAVQDLISLAEFLLNPSDQLALAEVLRSPLIGLEETDLEYLAMDRDKQSLWTRLEDRAARDGADAIFSSCFAWLTRLRQRLDFDRPYEFFANVLFGDGGFRRMRARLGSEVDDVIDEFLGLALEHENSEQPSLSGFVSGLRQSDISIKRELSDSTGGIRVMTVHGAKGLEAPIVILADATNERPDSSKLFVRGRGTPLLVYAPNNAATPAAIQSGLKQQAAEAARREYWRKLYVGMTRAEDELYLTGTLPERPTRSMKWYDRVESALGDQLVPHALIGEEGVDALSFPAPPPDVAGKQADETPTAPALPPTHSPLPAPALPRMISPSTAFDAAQPDSLGMAGESEGLLSADLARRRGTALHALLQHLEKAAPEDRAAAARQALSMLLPDAEQLHPSLTAKALSILGGPDAAILFGPTSRAEVPFAADAVRGTERVRLTGRIDRLVIEPERVLIVDFKSDAKPPAHADAVSEAYVTQLGLYGLVMAKLFVNQRIESALYWTGTESLMILDRTRLERAVSGYTLM